MRRATPIYVLLALGLASATPSTAHAQMPGRVDEPPSPPAPAQAPDAAPAITAPVVKKNEGASYPKQALDDGVRDAVQVPLILDIDATGAVTRAVVEKPIGHGFDEAAVAAGEKLEFEPATRGGKPVAARIRFTYTFTPPPSVLSGRVVTLVGEHPLAGARVVVTDSTQQSQTVTTDAPGAWRVRGDRL
jgi:TonB family protein